MAAMVSAPWVTGVLLVTLSLLPAAAAGQGTELVLEAGGSQFRPPVGVEGSPASFFMGGVRATRFLGFDSYVQGSLLGGKSLDAATSGDFVSAEVSASLWESLGRGWLLGSDVRAFAFEVGGVFPYRAGGLEGVAGIRLRSRGVAAEVSASAGWGRSRAELRRYADGPSVVVTDDLWRYGGTGQVLVGRGSVAVGVAAGVHESAGGRYRSAGGRLVLAPGDAAVEIRVDAWETPMGNQTTGGLVLVLPLGAPWVVRGFAGRSEPDPLTLAEPGSGGAGLLLGRRVAGGRDASPGRSLAELLEGAPGGRRVRFTLPDSGAQEVALLGDFTRWEPLPMTRQGDGWILVLDVPEGVYHFGFLVEGAWHVPEDAPDRVPDEWGRMSATLVVESSDRPSGDAQERQGAGR